MFLILIRLSKKGKIKFTNDESFSSSKLITNSFLENNKLHFMGPNHINTGGIKDVNYLNNTLDLKIWDIKIKLE